MKESMRALRWPSAVSLAVVCSAVLVVSPASATERLAAADSGTRLISCAHEPVFKPSSYVLACGDGNALLLRLRWSAWSKARAVAAGVYSVNDCQPYCAAGHFHNYPTNAVFDRPVRTRLGTAFDRMVLRFPRRAPPGGRTITQDHLVPAI